MVDFATVIEYLPKIIDVILKLSLLFIAIFFGRIALSGWKDRINIITRAVGTVVLGGICFVVGILLPYNFFPSIAFFSEMINSMIIAVFLYIILFFMSAKKSTGAAIHLRLKHDSFFLIGSILAVGFVVFVFTLWTPENISELDETFSFYGLQIEEKECLDIVGLLQKWNNNESKIESYEYDSAAVTAVVLDYTKSKFNVLPDVCGKQIIVEEDGKTYSAIFLVKSEINPVLDSCSVFKLLLVQRTQMVCSVDLTSNEVCDCQTLGYPRLTAQLTTALNSI